MNVQETKKELKARKAEAVKAAKARQHRLSPFNGHSLHSAIAYCLDCGMEVLVSDTGEIRGIAMDNACPKEVTKPESHAMAHALVKAEKLRQILELREDRDEPGRYRLPHPTGTRTLYGLLLTVQGVVRAS